MSVLCSAAGLLDTAARRLLPILSRLRDADSAPAPILRHERFQSPARA
jgi:hypothetical protein